jgi:hypothetical protein
MVGTETSSIMMSPPSATIPSVLCFFVNCGSGGPVHFTPMAEDLAAEEPAAEEPVAEELVAEEPAAEEPTVEEAGGSEHNEGGIAYH